MERRQAQALDRHITGAGQEAPGIEEDEDGAEDTPEEDPEEASDEDPAEIEEADFDED